MSDTSVSRTLVKSPPELWSELSDAGSLAEHLGEFGEIRITRLDPESTVAWEGESARGTVALEPTGWGTKVTLTAHPAEEATVEIAAVDEEAEAPAEPDTPEAAAPAPPKRARFAWLRRLRAETPGAHEAAPAPVAVARPEPEPGPATPFARQATAVLSGALDALGGARRQPFSRG